MRSAPLEALLGAVPIPLMLIGRNERVLATNRLADVLFGAVPAGRHYGTILRQPALLDCVGQSLASGDQVGTRYRTRDDTRDITYRATAAPVQTGGIDGVLLSLEDITDVQAAGQMRRDFVANVSHELRSPLTALSGFIETLRGPARTDPEAQDRFLAIMQREASRMSRLIEDLLSLARVEDEERMRPTGQADVAGLITSAVATLAPQADAAGVHLSISGAERALTVKGDPDQLLQVFTNLIENAIKYGGDAVTIALSVQSRDHALRGPSVRIVVADNGSGIDPLHIPRLTERFYRVDSHRSREVGGTGLGLAIVKHIINRHRGRLRIESEPGTGSRFAVVLPAPDRAVTGGRTL